MDNSYFVYLSLQLGCVVRALCASVLVNRRSLGRPRGTTGTSFKFPGVLWHRSRNSSRYAAGSMSSSRGRWWSRLLGMVGRWGHFFQMGLLTHLREPTMEGRLALCTPAVVGDLMIGVLFRVDKNGPGVLGSYWVVGLPCLFAVTTSNSFYVDSKHHGHAGQK